MTETRPDLKLDRRQGKHWDLDSALAYIEGNQPSSCKGNSKKKISKSVSSSPAANNSGCKIAASNTVKSKPVANTIRDDAVPGGCKLPSVKNDPEKTQLKKEVEKLQIQLEAEISSHAKVASNFQNLKIEMGSLKERNLCLGEEVASKKKLQKELEQAKTYLIKEQQLRKQSEANGKSELAAMASKEQKLQVKVQGLLKEQEKLQADLALETKRRLSVEQELNRIKIAAEEEKKRAACSRNQTSTSQSEKSLCEMPSVVRQLGVQQHQPSLAFCNSGRQVDIQDKIDQYLREEQEQMENFRKLKQMETGKESLRPSAHMFIHGL